MRKNKGVIEILRCLFPFLVTFGFGFSVNANMCSTAVPAMETCNVEVKKALANCQKLTNYANEAAILADKEVASGSTESARNYFKGIKAKTNIVRERMKCEEDGSTARAACSEAVAATNVDNECAFTTPYADQNAIFAQSKSISTDANARIANLEQFQETAFEQAGSAVYSVGKFIAQVAIVGSQLGFSWCQITSLVKKCK